MKRSSMDQENNAVGARQNGASKPYGVCDIVEDGSGPIEYCSEDLTHERGILTPRIVPIAGINMTTTTNPLTVGSKSDSIWATVNISAEVDSTELHNNGIPMPLDVVILLDNMYVFLLYKLIPHWS